MRVEFNENDARGQSNSSSPRRVAHEELGGLFEQWMLLQILYYNRRIDVEAVPGAARPARQEPN